jgi:hypothetical protein
VARKRPDWLARAIFVALTALAVWFAAATLGEPLGREQSSIFYVGRWWREGVMPYRDAFDDHLPGSYLVYAIATAVGGASARAIRVAELAGLLLAGLFAARTAARRPTSLLQAAPVMLLMVVGYQVSVDPRDAARPEVWAAIFLLGGQASLATDVNRRRAAIVSGLFCGMATAITPVALFFAPLFLAQALIHALAERPEPARLPSVVEICVAFGFGLVQPPAAFAAYFASRGGFAALKEAVRFGDPSRDVAWISGRPAMCALAIAIALFAAALIWPAERRRPLLIAPALLCCAAIGMLLGPPRTGLWMPLLAVGAAEGLIALGKRVKLLPIALAVGLWAVAHVATSVPAAAGHRRAQEMIGEKVRTLARLGDQLHVACDAPEIHVAAGLRSPARFFGQRPPRLGDAVQDDQRSVETKAPRFHVSCGETGSAFELRYVEP